MIKCIVDKDDKVKSVTISGHANYSEYGTDIVCSAVSMLSYAIANKIYQLGYKQVVNITDNKFEFNNNVENSDVNILLDTLVDGLYMVSDQYAKYIKIKEV